MSEASSKRTVRTVDVRPLIARGERPADAIFSAVNTLKPTEDLVVISPFLPSPLIEKLGSEGFRASPERQLDGAWQTRFSRK